MKNILRYVKNTSLFLTAALLLAGSTACGKKVTVLPSRLIIKTLPEEAKVFILGEERGKKLRVPPGTYILKFTHPGYKDAWVKTEVPRSKTVEVKFEMEKETADVMITSHPEKAFLEFRGVRLGMTPVVIRDLPHGEYKGTLSLPGHSTQDVRWRISSAAPQVIRGRLSSNRGTLVLDSKPAGAQIFLNGKAVGITPYRDQLPAGNYMLDLKKKDYAPLSKQIVISRGKTLDLNRMELEILRGAITVNSIPEGAKVYMNEKEYGQTPYTFRELLPGQYNITLRKEGFDESSCRVRLPAGASLRETIRLDSNRGGADIITQPANLTLYLNGKLLGISAPDPGNKKFSKLFTIRNLPAGTHTLTIYHKRGKPQKKQYKFTTSKGKIVRLTNVKLWVPNARVTYNTTTPMEEGRIIQTFPDGSIYFEPAPGITTRVAKNVIRNIEYLDDTKD